jgi:hypothetical protein
MNLIKPIFWGFITSLVLFYVFGALAQSMNDITTIVTLLVVLCGIVVGCSIWIVDTVKKSGQVKK